MTQLRIRGSNILELQPLALIDSLVGLLDHNREITSVIDAVKHQEGFQCRSQDRAMVKTDRGSDTSHYRTVLYRSNSQRK